MKRKSESQLQKEDLSAPSARNSSPPAAEESENGDKTLDANVTRLMQHQHSIDKLSEQCKWEKYKIEYTYMQKMSNFFADRAKMIEEIPEFWLRVFMNHEVISGCIGNGEIDVPLLNALRDIKMEMYEAAPAEEDAEGQDQSEQQVEGQFHNGFKVEFVFGENEWIDDLTLWKRFLYSPYDSDQLIDVQQSGVNWKKDARASATEEEPFESFFEFFEDRRPLEEEVFVLLKEEVFIDPMKYYLKPIDLGDEEGEGEE